MPGVDVLQGEILAPYNSINRVLENGRNARLCPGQTEIYGFRSGTDDLLALGQEVIFKTEGILFNLLAAAAGLHFSGYSLCEADCEIQFGSVRQPTREYVWDRAGSRSTPTNGPIWRTGTTGRPVNLF